MTTLLWLRRDLRRHDLPALTAAHRDSNDDVAVVFVVDPALWHGAGRVRRGWLARSVLAAREAYDGKLALLSGDPEQVVPQLAERLGARSVHVSLETNPGGAQRDRRVADALADRGIEFVTDGSPYAVAPGRVRNGEGAGYKVFTAFARAWAKVEVDPPTEAIDPIWRSVPDDPEAVDAVRRAADDDRLPSLPGAGEAAALERWAQFRRDDIADYEQGRDRPDQAGTSFLSPYLKVGAIHPRTLLADLAGDTSDGAQKFRTELAWREFYADVLWWQPHSAWHDLDGRLAAMEYDAPAELFTRWQEGRTGFPLVDAGMRQLAATGWMHGRVRMVAASFLAKDLHLWWPLGARFFLDHLIDGDLASNNHGWQWVAGTGTDAAPYFRVFNPVTQAKKFDPSGDYVRRWVPELAHLPGARAHEPWRYDDGYDRGYPPRCVDHGAERKVALERYDAARAAAGR